MGNRPIRSLPGFALRSCLLSHRSTRRFAQAENINGIGQSVQPARAGRKYRSLGWRLRARADALSARWRCWRNDYHRIAARSSARAGCSGITRCPGISGRSRGAGSPGRSCGSCIPRRSWCTGIAGRPGRAWRAGGSGNGNGDHGRRRGSRSVACAQGENHESCRKCYRILHQDFLLQCLRTMADVGSLVAPGGVAFENYALSACPSVRWNTEALWSVFAMA